MRDGMSIVEFCENAILSAIVGCEEEKNRRYLDQATAMPDTDCGSRIKRSTMILAQASEEGTEESKDREPIHDP